MRPAARVRAGDRLRRLVHVLYLLADYANRAALLLDELDDALDAMRARTGPVDGAIGARPAFQWQGRA